MKASVYDNISLGSSNIEKRLKQNVVGKIKTHILCLIISDLEDKLPTYNKINAAIRRHFEK
jgi:hypothetical protein